MDAEFRSSDGTVLSLTHSITLTLPVAPSTYTLTYTAGAGGTIIGRSPQTVCR